MTRWARIGLAVAALLLVNACASMEKMRDDIIQARISA
jgi:hypothetical protein